MPSLTRAWQMLLKGLLEVRDATRPISACEMALIRLAYAADLPPTDKLVRDILDGNAPRIAGRAVVATALPRRGGRGRHRSRAGRRGRASRRLSPYPDGRPGPAWPGRHRAPGAEEGAPVLKVHIENDMHLVQAGTGPAGIPSRPARAAHSGRRSAAEIARLDRRALDRVDLQ